MFKFSPLLSSFLCLSLSWSSSLLAQAATINGNWNMALPSANLNPKMELIQEGNILSGTFHGPGGDAPIRGEIRGQSVNFIAATKMGTVKFDGILEGSTMKGKADLPSFGPSDWTAAKK